MDDYENIIHEHNFQKEYIQQSLEIVKTYILFNKRILFGGTAIDMALRLKDKFIYPDNKLPDYDFYSPEFHIDAYRIGEQLVEAGIPAVSVIRATHASTMRVRVNFVSVADVCYIPTNIYEKIPTIDCDGFLCSHPHFQMIDQHRSLSLPFENPPFEVIVHRWKKDIVRHSILASTYPLSNVSTDSTSSSTSCNISINLRLMRDNCLGGYTALAWWIQNAKRDGMTCSGDYSITFSGDAVTYNGLNLPFTIISDSYQDLSDSLATQHGVIAYYNPILEKIPKRLVHTIKENKFEIIANSHRYLGAVPIDREGNIVIDASDKKKYMYVSGLQDVLCYLLTLYNLYNNHDARNAYVIAYKILLWATKKFSERSISDYSNSNLVSDKYIKYLPLVHTYGVENLSESYLINIEMQLARFRLPYRNYQLPNNAYPEPNKIIDPAFYDFRPSENICYQIDGTETIYEQWKELI